jgi:predicted Rossmann fold nucleotide-binding protein DprA/Smf involved in DNA uptake
MQKVQDQLSEVSKALSGLSKRVNKIAKRINKLGSADRAKSKRGGQPGRPAAARVRQDTVLDSVFKSIRRSRNGITIAQLKSKTALDDRQLSNALYKLTKKGMVYAKSRGVYAKS